MPTGCRITTILMPPDLSADPERRNILLWAPPRSTSTAFERAVMQHPDTAVFHEMLADCFYFGEDRSPKPLPAAIVESSKLQRDTSYAAQLRTVTDGASGPAGKRFAFSKELSIYFQAERLPSSMMAGFTHCFLIRKPENVVRSFLRVADKEKNSSTYFDKEEVGFAKLEQLYEMVTGELGQPPIVVDADDLLADPAGILEKWCAAVGVPFDACMTSWKAEEPTSWDKWPGWHNDAAGSSGFKPTKHADAEAELPADVRAVVEECQPVYDKLYAVRLH